MTTQGLSRIAAMFREAKAQGRSAFLPYFPIGYPNYDESVAAIRAMAAQGVDGFEIGMPFSDPLADGPTIQAATQTALDNGTTVITCLNAVRDLRAEGVEQPMMMMSYLNPLIAYGVDRFVTDAKAAGADGLIVPDLPPEESAALVTACTREGLALIFFLAPTTSPERIAQIAALGSGFLYVVSLNGVTGARTDLPEGLESFLERARAGVGDLPLVLGFGISTPEQARRMNDLVDGFIVGSALVRAGASGSAAVGDLAGTLRRALDG